MSIVAPRRLARGIHDEHAQLVAAAPDPLTALKALLAVVPDCEGDWVLDVNGYHVFLRRGIGAAVRDARLAIDKADRRGAPCTDATVSTSTGLLDRMKS